MAANTLHPAWTPEETERLIDLYQSGASWREITATLGRSKDSCRGKAYQLLLTKGQPKGYSNTHVDMEEVHELLLLGYNRSRIAAEMGLHPVTIRRHVFKHGSQRLKGLWTSVAKRNRKDGLLARWEPKHEPRVAGPVFPADKLVEPPRTT